MSKGASLSEDNGEIFRRSVIEEIPRLLGQLDRNPLSATYGCLDRTFWHYRTIDTAAARCQESALTFALLGSKGFSGNPYSGNQEMLGHADAALSHATRMQRPDGSFDEWYLNEGSFVCTSFVTIALCKSLGVLGDSCPSQDAARRGIERAAQWLMQNEDVTVANQVAGGALALLLAGRLLHAEAYEKEARRRMLSFLADQHEEGWWSEYGGPDAGYLSLTIDYLMQYFELTGEEPVRRAASKAAAFLLNFMHPDFTFGGEYLWRNTEYLMPSGITRLALQGDSHALILLSFARRALELRRGIHPGNLDDRYLCYVLSSWLEAGLLLSGSRTMLPDADKYLAQRALDTYLTGCGLRIFSKGGLHFVCSVRKGGSFRLYRGESRYADNGLELTVGSATYHSGIPQQGEETGAMSHSLSISGAFGRVKMRPLKTFQAIAFKSLQLALGFLPFGRRLLKRLLRRVLITPRPSSPYRFKRTFSLAGGSIEVRDRVEGIPSTAEIRWGSGGTYAFIPSSRYAPGSPSCGNTLAPAERRTDAGGGFELVRIFS